MPIVVAYNDVDISQWLNSARLEAAINAIETTNFASVAREYIMGLPRWRIPLTGIWDATLDGHLFVDVVTPVAAGRACSIDIYQQKQSSGVRYAWDSAVIEQASISGAGPEAAIDFGYELVLSGAPTRSLLAGELVSGAIFDLIADTDYLWQDIGAETSPVTANGQAVGTWKDTITGLLTEAYLTGPRDGVYTADSNGYPAVTFNDDAKYQSNGDSNQELDNVPGPRTYFMVLSSSDMGTCQVFQHATTAQNSASFYTSFSSGKPSIRFASGSHTTWLSIAGYLDGEIHIFTLTWDEHSNAGAATGVLRIDGTVIGVDTVGVTGTLIGWDELNLGGDSTGTDVFNGDLHRILGYDSVLALEDIEQNEQFLANLFGVTLA